MRSFVFSLLLSFSTVCSLAQIQLSYFNLGVHQNRILISFELSAGSTCNGITIERSTDSINFSTVHSYEGICGDPSFSVPYSWIDEAPIFNQTSYYRLYFSGTSYSQIYAVYIDKIGNDDYSIKSFYETKSIEMKLDFNTWKDAIISFYTIEGELIEQQKIKSGVFRVYFPFLSSEIVCFSIVALDKRRISGKFFLY